MKAKTKTFRERVAKFSAKTIAAATGCSLPTAYDWRSGRRAPVEWQRDKFIEDIKKHISAQ